MQRDPMDLFDEMDGLFARICSRMDREFMDGSFRGYGYHILITDGDESSKTAESDTREDPVTKLRDGPDAEVLRIGDEVKVIVDLPGAAEDDLRLAMRGESLIVDAGDAEHHMRTSVSLPPVILESMEKTLKNGVLEVSFRACSGS